MSQRHDALSPSSSTLHTTPPTTAFSPSPAGSPYDPDAAQLSRVLASFAPKQVWTSSDVPGAAGVEADSSRSEIHRDLLDLRLLHHFTLRTYAAMDPTAPLEQQRLWQDSVVRLGFRFPFLLRAILALAATHLSLDPTEPAGSRTTQLPLHAAMHLTAAISRFRVLLSEDGKSRGVGEQPAAVFVFACILVVERYASRQSAEPRLSEDPIDSLLCTFHLIRGTSTVLKEHWFNVVASEVSPLVANGVSDVVGHEVPEFTAVQEWMEGLPRHEDTVAGSSPGVSADLDALEELHRAYARMRVPDGKRSFIAKLFVWPVAITDAFLQRLDRRTPNAMLVLAYFSVLLRTGRVCWWLAGWDRAVFLAAEKSLHANPDYLAWLSWPRREIFGDGRGSEPVRD